MSKLLWKPSPKRIESAALTRFMREAEQRWGRSIDSFARLHDWSVTHLEEFWTSCWEFTGVIGERGERGLIDGDRMPGARFFPDATLNYARNLLRRDDDSEAIIFWGEDQVRQNVSWHQLRERVGALANAFSTHGIAIGDRIAGFTPNMPEAVVSALATAAIGAVWSSCSPDFGVRGLVDRFGQIEPRMLVCSDGYFYNGKWFDNLQKISESLAELPSIERVIVWPYDGKTIRGDLGAIEGAVTLEEFTRPHRGAEIPFVETSFDHPLCILFSSGTTGAPKCIVHRTGGALLQHLKEHQLHCDIGPRDRVFYFSTCSWMMWNWLVSALSSQATILLYDGSPFLHGGQILFEYAEREAMTLLGVSAKWLEACANANLDPAGRYCFPSLRLVTSTGSPLAPEGFDYVYDKIKQDVMLSSIAGGTDILACFMLGAPILPVYRGELQGAGLGMAVSIFDDEGRPTPTGEKGELVCTKPFPSMPIGFWRDDDGSRYHDAYFSRFPGIWTHGDFVERTERGGFIVHGRSDAILNPGGVRIGTAEIYRQVEILPEIEESIAIGQKSGGDVRVVLFVKLCEGCVLDDDLRARIITRIRTNTTPRHVPAKILAVADIPRTRSGKIVELAVRNIVHNEPVRNKEALANPEALEYFRNRPELAD